MNALVKPHPPFTSAEFHKMARRGAFGDLRVELRRGMILKMSPKHLPHATVQADLIFALMLAVKAAGLNWKVVTEASVAYGGGFEPMPDIVVYDPGLVVDPAGMIDPAAVKLIVEVADSSLADDMGEKREDYAQAGLVEYWVADVAGKILHQHAQPAGGAYGAQRTVQLGQPLAMLTRPEVAAQA